MSHMSHLPIPLSSIKTAFTLKAWLLVRTRLWLNTTSACPLQPVPVVDQTVRTIRCLFVLIAIMEVHFRLAVNVSTTPKTIIPWKRPLNQQTCAHAHTHTHIGFICVVPQSRCFFLLFQQLSDWRNRTFWISPWFPAFKGSAEQKASERMMMMMMMEEEMESLFFYPSCWLHREALTLI